MIDDEPVTAQLSIRVTSGSRSMVITVLHPVPVSVRRSLCSSEVAYRQACRVSPPA